MHQMFSPSTTEIPTNSDNSSMVVLYSLVGGINLIRNIIIMIIMKCDYVKIRSTVNIVDPFLLT